MKRYFILALILVMLVMTMSCSVFARVGTAFRYKTINGDKGSIELFSGGKVVKEFSNAKILYSDTDTNAIIFESGDDKYYFQEGFLFKY